MPNPVAVTARAKRNAVKMSHTTTFANPASTAGGVNVRVRARSVMATRTLTPIGTGCAISEITVAAKIASKCRCRVVKAAKGAK